MGPYFRGHASAPRCTRPTRTRSLCHGRVGGGQCLYQAKWVSGDAGASAAQTWGPAPAVSAQRPEPGTLVGAEAPLAVLVVAVRGGAPQLPVPAALAGAALMFLAQEGEGEDAGGTFRVPAKSGHDCGVRDTGQGQRGAQAPPPPGTTT